MSDCDVFVVQSMLSIQSGQRSSLVNLNQIINNEISRHSNQPLGGDRSIVKIAVRLRLLLLDI
jgi:hypothetical protein